MTMSKSAIRQFRKTILRTGAAVIILLVGVSAVALRGKWPGVIETYSSKGIAGVYTRTREMFLGPTPNVAWDTSPAQNLNFDAKKLELFRASLSASKTDALIIVRENRIVFEYYATDWDPNTRHSTAALGKTLTGSMLLMVMLNDGRIGLDDPLHLYIPEWRDDPVRRNITVRHIVTHSSGIEDVDFTAIHSDWKKAYYDNPDKRFRHAIETSPIRFAPGSQHEYSGVGYYALAYAIGVALRDSDVRDFDRILNDRIMLPLGIPHDDWSISYQATYDVDGMRLSAIGSGGAYTPRAIARIGQLLLNGGSWDDRNLLDRHWIDQMMSYGGSPPVRQKNSTSPATGIGTWLNCDGFWPSLPRDSVIGFGGRYQILLVIPSLDLVVVRTGRSTTDDFWRDAETEVFNPLLATLTDTIPNDDRGSCAD